MKRRGVCYDVGRVLDGQNWRPELSVSERHRELEIIGRDLHCNAVKIHGQDISTLLATAEDALSLGLEAWLAPEMWDRTADETLGYVIAAASDAQRLYQRWPGRVYLSVGTELTFFMRDILEGATFGERLANPGLIDRLRAGTLNEPLNEFLARASDAVRRVFGGGITYASLPFEQVEWRRFDFVGVDLYRDATNRESFADIVRRYVSLGRPVTVTECGCCTYRGAEDAGGQGSAIIDITATPPRLKAPYVRDEALQAHELTQLVALFDAAGVDGTFIHTFVQPLNAYNADPRFDFDMASFSLVKSYANRLGGLDVPYPEVPWDARPSGVTYPDLPWEPKESFWAVARAYEQASALP